MSAIKFISVMLVSLHGI